MIKMNKGIIVGIIAAVIIIVVILAAVAYKPPAPAPITSSVTYSSTSSSTSQSSTTTSSTTTTTTEPYQVTILDVIDGHSIAAFDGEPSYTYLIINLSIAYNGPGTFCLFPANFCLVTSEGIYKACIGSLLQGTPNYLPQVKLGSGEHIIGCIAFKIPSSATPQELKYKCVNGCVLFEGSVPSPNKYIIAIGDLFVKSNLGGVSVFLCKPFGANIFAYSGQQENFTIKIFNNCLNSNFCYEPVVIKNIKITNSCITIVNANQIIGKKIAGDSRCIITLTLRYPNKSCYFNTVCICFCFQSQ